MDPFEDSGSSSSEGTGSLDAASAFLESFLQQRAGIFTATPDEHELLSRAGQPGWVNPNDQGSLHLVARSTPLNVRSVPTGSLILVPLGPLGGDDHAGKTWIARVAQLEGGLLVAEGRGFMDVTFEPVVGTPFGRAARTQLQFRTLPAKVLVVLGSVAEGLYAQWAVEALEPPRHKRSADEAGLAAGAAGSTGKHCSSCCPSAAGVAPPSEYSYLIGRLMHRVRIMAIYNRSKSLQRVVVL